MPNTLAELQEFRQMLQREANALLNEFKNFITKGNVIDLAVGVILGLAFGRIVTSLVEDVIMPPIGLLLGNTDFSNLFINLSGESYPSLAAARAAGAATINYGMFINTVLSFVVVAFAVFLLVKWGNRYRRDRVEAAVTRPCPHCLSLIPTEATRCAACTSQVEPLRAE